MRAESLADGSVAEQFRELAREFPEDRPMYELVGRLCRKDYAVLVGADTSLQVLFVNVKSAAVSVDHGSCPQQFRVRIWAKNERCETRWCSEVSEAERLFDAFVLRAWLSEDGDIVNSE
jgi:hypothetical protein